MNIQPTVIKRFTAMKILRQCFPLLLIAVGLVFNAQAVAAHEFWMWARPFQAPVNTAVKLSLYVGQHFDGDKVGFTSEHAAVFRLHDGGTSTDLRSRLPVGNVLSDFVLALKKPGSPLVSYDSQPSNITLSADKFHAYLNEEGLEAIIRQREAAGTAQLPARERYRRHIKCLLQVGGKPDNTPGVPIGQRLELVPLVNPYAKAAGDTLVFQLQFDGQPLAGALVKAWHKQDDQTTMIRARTNNNGQVAFTLPYAGGWMLSVVHMVAVDGTSEVDWDSFWGNLSFELPAARLR